MDFSENSNEFLCFIEGGEFLDKVSSSQLLNNDSVS
jgi:hypothetical protein